MPPSAKRGRPKRADPPRVDYKLLDKLLVIGEPALGPDGEWKLHYPSYRDLADRFGVAHSLVAKYVKEHNCIERRAYGAASVPFRQRLEQAQKSARRASLTAPSPTSSGAIDEAPEMSNSSWALAHEHAMADVTTHHNDPVPSGHDEIATEPGDSAPMTAAAADDRPHSAHSLAEAATETLAIAPVPTRTRAQDEPVDTQAMDLWLVHGEAVPIDGTAGFTIVYPPRAEIARRLGIKASDVAAHARKHDCERRRKEVQARVHAKVDQKLVEVRAATIAETRERALQIIDDYIAAFHEALQDGRVRTDSVQDFNLMIRLRSFVEGGADQRAEVLASFSLDELRTSHRDYMRDERGDTPSRMGFIEAEIVEDVVPASPACSGDSEAAHGVEADIE